MKEFEKHVLDERTSNIKGEKISFCKIKITDEWVFKTIDQVVNNHISEGRLLPCKECCKQIKKIIKEI